MPSLGHVAVGLAAGRFHTAGGGPRLRATAVFTALAVWPDLDFKARALGAAAGSPWLHRGASHSLLAAAAAALVATALAGGMGQPRVRTFLTALAAAASHGLLDALTRGAAGPMLLWPFTDARFLAPLALVPASPFLPRLLSARGLSVLLREALVFLPLLAYGLWPRRRPALSAPDAGSPG
ncbi:MAG: metal-dependent hydrolase [Anaeromyxobacter sp.]